MLDHYDNYPHDLHVVEVPLDGRLANVWPIHMANPLRRPSAKEYEVWIEVTCSLVEDTFISHVIVLHTRHRRSSTRRTYYYITFSPVHRSLILADAEATLRTRIELRKCEEACEAERRRRSALSGDLQSGR